MKKHDCYENIEVTGDCGDDNFLTCNICGNKFDEHRFTCWIKPYPHLSDESITELLRYLECDFTDDYIGEIEVPREIVEENLSYYMNRDNVITDSELHFGAFNQPLKHILEFNPDYGSSLEVYSKGCYFFEFSDNETFKFLKEKISKLEKDIDWSIG